MGQEIGAKIKMECQTMLQNLQASSICVTLYHGTTAKRWASIQRSGCFFSWPELCRRSLDLDPPDCRSWSYRNDKRRGEAHNLIYFTNVDFADWIAYCRSTKEDQPVVLQLQIPLNRIVDVIRACAQEDGIYSDFPEKLEKLRQTALRRISPEKMFAEFKEIIENTSGQTEFRVHYSLPVVFVTKVLPSVIRLDAEKLTISPDCWTDDFVERVKNSTFPTLVADWIKFKFCMKQTITKRDFKWIRNGYMPRFRRDMAFAKLVEARILRCSLPEAWRWTYKDLLTEANRLIG